MVAHANKRNVIFQLSNTHKQYTHIHNVVFLSIKMIVYTTFLYMAICTQMLWKQKKFKMFYYCYLQVISQVKQTQGKRVERSVVLSYRDALRKFDFHLINTTVSKFSKIRYAPEKTHWVNFHGLWIFEQHLSVIFCQNECFLEYGELRLSLSRKVKKDGTI